MLLDVKLDGKYIVVVGGGGEGYRKTLNFVDSDAKILVASREFSSGIKRLHQMKKIDLLETEVKDAKTFVTSLNPKPDLLLAVTSNHELNAQIVKHAKSAGCIVYAVDDPSISDFVLPAVAKLGEVRIAISTFGKSPAMARVLRQRIEKMVTEEDLQQIKLQTYARAFLKQHISDQKVRRQILYKLLKNEQVKQLLKENRLDEAKEMTLKILENWVENPIAKKHSATGNQNFQEA
ncbi:MAG: bifunctional precorrin-2 dehydrogenase/sirohydrochlorin ferrochelatase [Candidatus Bathyarchaeota archaeon]|nr:bifunctional precorrin-2 dehydrogenase/sirohydrochlorin ferrochelatase [Candidatus Bathyarchaeota archaeon]